MDRVESRITALAGGSDSPRVSMLAGVPMLTTVDEAVASSVLTVRVGRIAFFAHEPQAAPDLPSVVQKWLVHEESILGAVGGARLRRPLTDWAPGAPGFVWRLLSGNNREIGRGVGVYRSLIAARDAAERARADAERIEPVYVFDRRSSHGWCLRSADEALVVSPLWHRSRRSNRLNLDTVRATLGRAEVNDVATLLSGPIRTRGGLPS